MYFIGDRAYDPSNGRFTSQDTAAFDKTNFRSYDFGGGDPVSMYSRNDPIRQQVNDPLGEFASAFGNSFRSYQESNAAWFRERGEAFATWTREALYSQAYATNNWDDAFRGEMAYKGIGIGASILSMMADPGGTVNGIRSMASSYYDRGGSLAVIGGFTGIIGIRESYTGQDYLTGDALTGTERFDRGVLGVSSLMFLGAGGAATALKSVATASRFAIGASRLAGNSRVLQALSKFEVAPVKGGRGPATSWNGFDEALAGGTVRDLTTNRIKVTGRGIDVVEGHVSRFGPDSANSLMIDRLRRISRGELQATAQDLNFYSHELREFVRYRRLGWKNGVPADSDAAMNLWRQAHTGTLGDYNLPLHADELLYHPDALKLLWK
jgi:hypothetical protein